MHWLWIVNPMSCENQMFQNTACLLCLKSATYAQVNEQPYFNAIVLDLAIQAPLT